MRRWLHLGAGRQLELRAPYCLPVDGPGTLGPAIVLGLVLAAAAPIPLLLFQFSPEEWPVQLATFLLGK